MTRSGRLVSGGLAAAFLADVVSRRAELLVRPWFIWVLLGTAALLAVVAARTNLRMSSSAIALLALPVAVGVTITPSLAGRAAQGTTQSTAPATRIGDGENPLVGGRGGRVTLLQILQAEQQVGGVVIAGRPVSLDAVVAGPHRLQRSVIVCCAADAQTIGVDERGVPLPPAGRWVHITGRLDVEGTRTILVASSVAPIPTPANPFL